MELTYKKIKIPHILVLMFFIAFSSQNAKAQAVTEIITDYNGYWKSAAGAVNPIKPDNSHNLVSFSYNGVRYSTGVNDALLTSNGQAFNAQDFKALSIQNMIGTPTNDTFIGLGQMYDGVDNGASNPAPVNNLPYYVTDGINGLDIGTCATNIPSGAVNFSISDIDPASIGDGVPDILITQVAQPAGTTDVYRFKDANGNVIGTPINIVLDNITPVGNWVADFYRVLSNPMIILPGFVKTERPIRLWAADLSDFGITASNYASISSFVINLHGTSDIAFIAYNFATATVVPLTPGLSFLKEGTYSDTNNDCVASVGDTVNYTFKVTNTGETPLTNITITDASATLSGEPITLAPGASNNTNFTGIHILTQADITAGAVYNLATATATAPAPVNIITATSQDPTPISTTSPYYDPNCEFCTVVVLSSATSITVATVVQPTCTITTGSITLTGLPAGNYTINPGGITTSGSSYTISGLTPGTYNFTITNDTGCVSPSLSVTINPSPAPLAPIVGAITNPTCEINTGSVVLSGFPDGEWTINPGQITGSGSTYTISNLVANNTYNFTVTNADGCTSSSSIEVVINAAPIVPSAPIVNDITNPTCSVPTGSVILGGLPSGNYTINPGNIAGSGETFTITGLNSGTYNFTVTNADGCISTAATVVITPSLDIPAPVASVINPTCTVNTGSIILSGLPSGNYTINPGNIVASGETFTITGLNAGTYAFTITNAEGCTSSSSIEVVINAAPIIPTAPIVNDITNPTCSVPTGSIILGGLPSGNYTINPGNIAGSGETFTITGLNAGTYNFTVTNADGCISTASTVVITPSLDIPAPVASVINPTCAVNTGSIVLSGLPSGNYTINPGNIVASGETFTITGLTAGTYAFTITNADGCTSSSSIEVVINAAPIVPTAPIVNDITNPTCSVPTGSVILGGLPSGNYTINPGNIAGSGETFTITGLNAGTYNFTVTNADGCISTASTVVITPSLDIPAPVASVINPTCAVNTGSIVLSGLPSGNYTINPGNIVASGETFTITGLTAGTYAFTITNADGCTSSSSIEVVINAAPIVPTAPIVNDITNPTCSVPTGSVILGGLPSGNYTINPGNIAGSGETFTITGLNSGTYNFTVTNADGCISTAATVVITPSLDIPAPVASVINPTCAVNTGSIILSGLPSGNYTINPGNIVASGETFTIAGLTANTIYNFTITNSDGCTSAASIDVIIGVVPTPPTAPVVSTITNPTCANQSGSVELNGLPAGNYIINPGNIAATGSTYTVTDLPQGTVYNFTVTNPEGCTSEASAAVSFVSPNTTLVLTSDIAKCNTDIEAIYDLDEKFLVPNSIDTGGVWTSTQVPADKLVGSTFTATGVPVGDYQFTYTITDNFCIHTVELTIKVDDDCIVLPAATCVIKVHNAFSPNNDGINDVFIIDNILNSDCNVSNSVEIYNRWGILVYETQQYDNNVRAFKGFSEGRATVGNSEPLPTGTYFYIVNFTNTEGVSDHTQGYLYLSR